MFYVTVFVATFGVRWLGTTLSGRLRHLTCSLRYSLFVLEYGLDMTMAMRNTAAIRVMAFAPGRGENRQALQRLQ